jgi:hypothetical protein
MTFNVDNIRVSKILVSTISFRLYYVTLRS